MAKWVIRTAKTSGDDKKAFAAAGISEEQAAQKLTYKFLRLSETKAYGPFKTAIENAVADLAEALLVVGDKEPELSKNLQNAISTLPERILGKSGVADSVTLQADSVRKASGLPFAAKKVAVAKVGDDEVDNEVEV